MKFKFPSIPKDDDAKNIVVRVLSFEYYLRPFWLTFKDPYIEVEYQISTRRMRLKQSIYNSIFMMFIGFYILTVAICNEKIPIIPKIIYYSTNNTIRYLLLYIITGITMIITSIIQIIIVYIKSINNIFNWPILFIIKNTLIMLVFFFFIIDSFSTINYDKNLSTMGNDFKKYMYIFETGLNQTISIFMNIMFILTLINIHILNIQQYLILILIHTSFLVIFILRYYNLVLSTDFTNLYHNMGWRIGGVLIHDIWNNKIDNSNSAMVVRNTKIMLSKKEITENIWPYEDSIFNINIYLWNTIKIYILLWINLVLFLFYVIYTREKGLRADFILRRVQSNKDEPRNLESGIKIQSFINTNETQEDQQIILDNLNRWKKDSCLNSSINQNFVIEVDLEEKESAIDDLNLMEIGSALDGKSVKSFNSDNSFIRNKNNIIKNIVPKSYTKSEIDNLINDTESESHVQC